MHDIDRTLREQEFGNELEFNQEFGNEFEQEAGYEFGQETGYEFGQEFIQELGQEFSPELENEYTGELAGNLEMELTNELLTVTNEQELNQFVGNLLAKAASGFVQSPTGQSVGRFLVNFGKNTLPQVAANLGGQAGGALGARAGKAFTNRFGGGIVGQALSGGLKQGGAYLGKQGGAWLGNKAGNWVASKAQRVFNLEFEGLSPEDREYEIARSYVQFASEIARRASAAARNNPRVRLSNLSRQIIPQAAQLYAPGLISGGDGAASIVGLRRRGTWERRGKSIILYEYQ
ncbi:hypothetical protein [Adhaeribacter aerolatus]|nr:hypothetical protein [Adhaeribacter aerolatus]